jgi:hypothetical protein
MQPETAISITGAIMAVELKAISLRKLKITLIIIICININCSFSSALKIRT